MVTAFVLKPKAAAEPTVFQAPAIHAIWGRVIGFVKACTVQLEPEPAGQ